MNFIVNKNEDKNEYQSIKPSQIALAQVLGCLLTKPKTKVMVPILTQFEFGKINVYLKIMKLFKVDLVRKLSF